MCGRYALNTTLTTILDLFRTVGPVAVAEDVPDPFVNLDARPTQELPVLRQVGEVRRLDLLRWGLVPAWAKDPSIGSRMINARSEEASGKPAFRAAMRARRCVVPASGFYEWRAVAGRRAKQPVLFRPRRGALLGLAGLWEVWRDRASGQERTTFAILTTSANGTVAPIHDRMPVVLDPGDVDLWLEPGARPEELRALLVPAPDDLLEAVPVRGPFPDRLELVGAELGGEASGEAAGG